MMQIKLNLNEYELAGRILQLINPNLSVLDVDVAYRKAIDLVNGIDYGRSLMAVMVWKSITQMDLQNLFTAVVCKEITQIIARIDAEDSIVDYFGWLLVAKMHGVDVMKLLQNIYAQCRQFIAQVC
jgi:hypothetical protein